MRMNKFVGIIAMTCFAVGLLCPQVRAQKVQWAGKVLEKSSELRLARTPGQFSAREALGAPDKLPATGSSPVAWTPEVEGSNREEFIKVAYRKPMYVQQIAIAENFNPGAIYRILLFDTKNKPHVVYENPLTRPAGVEGRMWNLFIDRTPYKVRSVMVTLKTSTVKGFNQIDAIGIADHRDTVRARINLAEGLTDIGERENLGPNVNSDTDELCPIISPDGKTLYFTRHNHPGNIGGANDTQDIWYCEVREDGSFSPAKNVGEPLNSPLNNSLTAVTPDGQTALLLNRYNRDGTMDQGVSMARRKGESWAFPEPLEVPDYYNLSDYGEYCLSSSGKVLVMTLQRKESIGSKDMYVCFRKADGTWTAPKHMGKTVNTADSEVSPFLAADDVTLYYSTAGKSGHGSNDMFVTRRLDSTWTKWSKPENLGPQLNTTGWDAYYSIPASGEYVYFVSYSNSIGKADIFRAPLPASVRPNPVVLIRGKVLNDKTGAPLAARIVYESLTTGEEIGVAHSDPRDGSYSIVLPAGQDYGFLAQADEFVPVSEHMDLTELDEYREMEQDLRLVPFEKGQTIRLNNIFFDTDKFDLRDQSFRELARLMELMDAHPTMAIEIAGHTDDVGSDSYNQKLSQNRANAVRSYLVDKGVVGARLKAVGYGEKKPLKPNTSDAARQLNRRVEFTILSE